MKLYKSEPVTVGDKAPFDNDRLNRRVCAENLSDLISTLTQPFVLAVNGSWGCGKTTFIQMWMAMLRKDGYSCFSFNAWENDFTEDPLEAFIGEIDAQREDWITRTAKNPRIEKAWKKVRAAGIEILKRAGPLAVKAATHGLLDLGAIGESSGVAEFAEKIAEDKLAQYLSDRKTVTEFRDSLAEFTAALREAQKDNRPLVFFVDELDRCRPLFAVQLLERIKHLFSVNGIVFVLAIDRKQLAHTVQSAYGVGFDGDGYLRRFIDLNYGLPDAPVDAFITHLWTRFRLPEVMSARGTPSTTESIIDIFAGSSKVFGLSLRTIEQCFTEFNVAARTSPRGTALFEQPLVFFICFRAHSADKFRQYCSGEIGAEDVTRYIRNLPGGNAFFAQFPGDRIEAYLYAWSRRPGEFHSKLNQLQHDLNDQKADPKARSNVERLLPSFNHFLNSDPKTLDQMLVKLFLTQRFASN